MEIEFIMQILSNQSMFNFACFMFICCAFVWLCEKARSYIIRLFQYISNNIYFSMDPAYAICWLGAFCFLTNYLTKVV